MRANQPEEEAMLGVPIAHTEPRNGTAGLPILSIWAINRHRNAAFRRPKGLGNEP